MAWNIGIGIGAVAGLGAAGGYKDIAEAVSVMRSINAAALNNTVKTTTKTTSSTDNKEKAGVAAKAASQNTTAKNTNNTSSIVAKTVGSTSRNVAAVESAVKAVASQAATAKKTTNTATQKSTAANVAAAAKNVVKAVTTNEGKTTAATTVKSAVTVVANLPTVQVGVAASSGIKNIIKAEAENRTAKNIEVPDNLDEITEKAKEQQKVADVIAKEKKTSNTVIGGVVQTVIGAVEKVKDAVKTVDMGIDISEKSVGTSVKDSKKTTSKTVDSEIREQYNKDKPVNKISAGLALNFGNVVEIGKLLSGNTGKEFWNAQIGVGLGVVNLLGRKDSDKAIETGKYDSRKPYLDLKDEGGCNYRVRKEDMEIVLTAMSFIPGIGDGADVALAYQYLNDGRLQDAAVTIALTIINFDDIYAVGKLLKETNGTAMGKYLCAIMEEMGDASQLEYLAKIGILDETAEGIVKGGSKTIDDIIDNLPETTNGKGVARNFESTGGFDQTIKDFDALNPTDVKEIQTQYGTGKVGKLSDGTTVVARPGSTTGGATLEIRVSNSKVYKIRY